MDYTALHKRLILQLRDTRSRDGAVKFQSRGCTGTTGRLLVLLCTALPTSKNRSAEELRSREGGWVINTLILVQLPVAMGRQARRHCHTKGHGATTATGPGPAGPDCNRNGKPAGQSQHGCIPAAVPRERLLSAGHNLRAASQPTP